MAICVDQSGQRGSKAQRVAAAGAFVLRLRNMARGDDRPVVQQPALGDALQRHRNHAARPPMHGMRLLHLDLGQSPEQRQLVGGNLAIAVQDALDLICGAQRARGAQFEQQRRPARAVALQGIAGVPAPEQLQPDALEKQLQGFRHQRREQPTVGVAVVLQSLAAAQRHRDQQSPVRAQQGAQRERGVEQLGLRQMHQHGAAQHTVEVAAERRTDGGQGARGDSVPRLRRTPLQSLLRHGRAGTS